MNTASATCRITGYPGVALFDASGRKLGDASRTSSGFLGGVGYGGSSPSPILELRPRETASALVEAVYQGGNPAPCATATTLDVTPPDETHSVRIATNMYSCQPEIHPIVPGTTGRAGQ